MATIIGSEEGCECGCVCLCSGLVVWYVLLIKPGLENATFFIANKKTGWTRDEKMCQFFQSDSPSLAVFGASLVLSTIVLTGN